MGQPGPPGAPGQPGAQGPAGSGAADFCGLSEPLSGDLGGYQASSDECLEVCGGDDGAHMCSGHEVAQVLQGPGIQAPAWYAGIQNDCAGWTSADPGESGTLTPANITAPAGGALGPCSELRPVACCR